MAKYETSVCKELICEAVINQQKILSTEYPDFSEDIAAFFSEEKHWKRTRKGKIPAYGRSDSTQLIFKRGATERMFDFKHKSIELRVFIYTDLEDEKVINLIFMIMPSRKMIEVYL